MVVPLDTMIDGDRGDPADVGVTTTGTVSSDRDRGAEPKSSRSFTLSLSKNVNCRHCGADVSVPRDGPAMIDGYEY